MIEVDTPSSSKGFTRRQFVQGTAVVGAAAMLESLDFLPRPESASERITALKDKIYDDFGVTVIDPAEARELTGITIEPQIPYFPRMEPPELTENGLHRLHDLYSIMPAHFLGDQNGEQPHVTIDHMAVSQYNCYGMTYYDRNPNKTHDQDVAYLDPRLLAGSFGLLAQKGLHEYAHRWDLDMTDRRIHKYMAEACGGDFEKIAPEMQKQLQIVNGQALTRAQAAAFPLVEFAFRGRTAFGKKIKDPREVVASFSELYFYGEDIFIEGMELYVGKERAKAIYDVLRDHVFLQVQYVKEAPTITL